MLERPDDQTDNPEQVKLSAQVLLAKDGLDNQKLISYRLRAGAGLKLPITGQLLTIWRLMRSIRARRFCYSHGYANADYGWVHGDREAPARGYAGPIIALTAHAMSGDRDKCIDAGCDDYTTRAIKVPELTVHRYATGGEIDMVPMKPGEGSDTSSQTEPVVDT